MKFRFIFVILLGVVLYGCDVDPFESTNSYQIENATTDPIQVYGISHSNDTNSILIEPSQKKEILDILSWNPILPSKVFQSIVFLTTTSDTLSVLKSINDADWQHTDTIINYKTYCTRDNYWQYTFKEQPTKQ